MGSVKNVTMTIIQPLVQYF